MKLIEDTILNIQDLDKKKIIEKVVITVNMQEQKRWNMPVPDLTELELGVLQGIIEGRNSDEIKIAIKQNDPKDSYHSVVHRLRRKLDAFTLAHAVYKAVKLGLV